MLRGVLSAEGVQVLRERRSPKEERAFQMIENVNMERMRPKQLLAAIAKCPVVYVPLAPLEWHGPHLPLNVDAIHATAVCEGVAQIVGGVVYPTTYLGTETRRSRQELKDLGFQGDEHVVGMDFPANSVPSMYLDEGVYGIVVKEIVRLLKRTGFQVIMLMSGHGALNHNRVLMRIAAEESDDQCQVVYRLVFSTSNEQDTGSTPSYDAEKDDDSAAAGVGHASRDETSLAMYLCPDDVDLSELPSMTRTLHYTDWGIVDGNAFVGRPTKGYVVRPDDDPRKATPEHGFEFVSSNIKIIADEVRQLFHR
jgi:creatinine amidohydrolase